MLDNDPHIWRPIVESAVPVGFVGGFSQSLHEVIGDRLSVLGDTFAAGMSALREWLDERTGG